MVVCVRKILEKPVPALRRPPNPREVQGGGVYVDAGASAFGAEGALVLWSCDVFLLPLGRRWLRGWDLLLSN